MRRTTRAAINMFCPLHPCCPQAKVEIVTKSAYKHCVYTLFHVIQLQVSFVYLLALLAEMLLYTFYFKPVRHAGQC